MSGVRDGIEVALAAIEAREPALRAYAHLDPAAARKAADRLDAGAGPGPLGGAAVAVKDIFDTADMPTCCGSPTLAGRRPTRDAAAVAAIRAAGGVIVGKSVTAEFAFAAPGPTTNPHDPHRTPGGSSSGSAATVAAGGARFATGTQTAGSIIRPAAFCGVVGFKPSFGIVSRSGVLAFAESLDTVGGFATKVADAALLVGAMARHRSLMTAEVPDRPPRLGLYLGGDFGCADSVAVEALEVAASRLSAAGATVTTIALPPACDGLARVALEVMEFEAATALAWEAASCADGLSDALKAALSRGAALTGDDHRRRLDRVAHARRALAQLFGEIDAILTLSAPGEAPVGLTSTGDSAFNRVWTLLGVPAIHLPTATGPAGMPLGVTLAGGPLGDLRLVRTALWAEAALEGRAAGVTPSCAGSRGVHLGDSGAAVARRES